LREAIETGLMAKQLRAVTLTKWKDTTKTKTRARLSGGVEAAMDKRRAFDKWLVDTLNDLLPEIAAMPDLTIDDMIERAAKLIRTMHERKYRKP